MSIPLDSAIAEPLVGRQRELAALRARLAAAAAGRGGLVLLAGEAGVGKTALLRRFAAEAREHGAAVLWGACFEGEWRPPYSPWVEALSELVAGLSDTQLLRYLGAGAPPLAQLVPALRARLPATAPPAALPAHEERYRLADALSQLLAGAAAERPLVLVLDDLHWADRDTLEVLRYVARFAVRCPLLLLGAYRDPDGGAGRQAALDETLAILQREADPARLLVRGFSLPEVAAYLTQAAEQALPQALVQTIFSETAGNPFYIRELFRHLVEEAKIERRAGRWITDFSLSELSIPPGVRQVVARRLARLAPATSALLRVAAAFTGGFRFALLPALTGLPEEALLNSLDEALLAGLLRTAGGPAPRYDFAHAIVRHTLYEGMNPDRRARLHRQIAQVIEQLAPGQAADHAELAFQYHASAALPGTERGIAHCLAAATAAGAGYAHEQEVMFLRMARDLAGHAPASQRAEIAARLAMAEAHALQLGAAQASAETALQLLIEAGAPPDTAVAAVAGIARALKDAGAPPAGWAPLAERALALLAERRGLLWARLELLRGRIEPVADAGIYISRWAGHDAQAVAVARAQGDEDDYAQTLEPLEWRTPAETAAVRALAQRWQRPTAVLRALDVAGRDLIFQRGETAAARECFTELLAAGQRYGSIPAQAEALTQLAFCHAILGDLELARTTLEQARGLVARLGVGHRLHTLAILTIETVLGDYGEADWPQLAQTFTRIVTDPQTLRGMLGLTAANFAALSTLRAGDTAGAHRLLALLTPVLERLPHTTYLYNGGVDRGATAVWELGAAEYAGSYRRLALGLLAAGLPGSPYRSNALTVARMAALLGAAGEAGAYFAQARQALDASGQRPLRAIVDYDEAWALVRLGAAGQARVAPLIEAAVAQFRALGMPLHEQRALALQAQVAAPGHSQAAGFPHSLTAREAEVLRLIGAGATNKEIAARLTISITTVERHIANIYNKIGVRNRAEATAFAFQQGLV